MLADTANQRAPLGDHMTSESQKTRRGRVKKAAEEEEEGFTFFSSGGAGCCRSVSSMLTTLTLREHTNNTNTHTSVQCVKWYLNCFITAAKTLCGGGYLLMTPVLFAVPREREAPVVVLVASVPPGLGPVQGYNGTTEGLRPISSQK